MEQIEREVTLPASTEEAWDLISRPDELSGWLGDEVVLSPTPGAVGVVVEHDGTRRHLVVEEAEVGRRLTWRWWSEGDDPDTDASRVEITLAPTSGGTLLHVVERPSGPVAGLRAQAADAWSHRLLHLEMLVLAAWLPVGRR